MEEQVITNAPFINKQVDDFYKFAAEMYIEFKSQPEKHMVPVKQVAMDNAEGQSNEQPIVETRQQTFQEYFLYKLYYKYGVRRRMINEHIALLFYAKNLKGYKPRENITMLCRHMMLDMRNLRIISLGIPKAMKLDDFINEYNIDMDGVNKTDIFRVYKFPEGTMITYNPSLEKYNVDTSSVSSIPDGDDEENNDGDGNNNETDNIDIIQQTLDTQFTKLYPQLFQYSTRKVIGTGRFSSTKTFLEMFNENNAIANTNLENIPAEIMKDKVLIFNIEHPENRIISMQARNFNTLCAVYEFKADDIATAEYNAITSINIANPTSENTEAITNAFQKLGTNMITQIHVSAFKQLVQEFGANLHMPEVIKCFEVKNADGILKIFLLKILVLIN